MKPYIISIASILVAILAIDSIWLTTMSERFYKPHMNHFMLNTIKMTPAALFYTMYSISISILITVPALKYNYSFIHVFALGALLGFTAYGAYDLVNHATIKGWPMILTVVDMTWGTLLTGIVTVIGYKMMQVIN